MFLEGLERDVDTVEREEPVEEVDELICYQKIGPVHPARNKFCRGCRLRYGPPAGFARIGPTTGRCTGCGRQCYRAKEGR